MLTGSEQPKRILVVDDDAEIRGVLATALRPHGLIVDLAENGREALDLLRENVYTVMVLDLLMPVADGFTVLDGLRARDAQPMPVVLVLTGAETRVVRQLDLRVESAGQHAAVDNRRERNGRLSELEGREPPGREGHKRDEDWRAFQHVQTLKLTMR